MFLNESHDPELKCNRLSQASIYSTKMQWIEKYLLLQPQSFWNYLVCYTINSALKVKHWGSNMIKLVLLYKKFHLDCRYGVKM